MKRILILSLLLNSLISFATDYSVSTFFDAANTFFKTNVKNGLVNYAHIKTNRSSLDKLVRQIATEEIASLSKTSKKAFYINSYNILVIKSLVDNMPIKSPLDKKGFFDITKHKVAGENLALNDIENKKLRAVYNDARIHFVLVCGAKGCPKIIPSAYYPEKLEAQLNAQTKQAVNSTYFIRVKDSEKKVSISEIFKWYADDFNSYGSIISFLNKYRATPIPSSYKLDYYTYDWNINKQ